MDPNEIIKYAPELLKSGSELVKTGAEIAGAFKFTEIIKAFLGDATGEVAERFKDTVRLYRYGRQLECLKKAEKMATEAGFTPKAVPIKLLFPLLEGASLEENEDLHTMWAALLANAASPHESEKVRPGFIAALEQMAPDEAFLLNCMVEWDAEPMYAEGFETQRLLDVYGREKLGPSHPLTATGTDDDLPKIHKALTQFGTCINGLEANGLIRRSTERNEHGLDVKYTITWRGYGLIHACRPPGAK